MCGIFGWIYRADTIVSDTQKTIIAAILSYGNDSRGGNSWGYAAISEAEENEIVILRGLGNLSPQSQELWRYAQIMAHCRLATTGNISIENSHPFEIGGIIGAHNGIIYNHEELNANHNRKFNVDSMHLFAHLSEARPMEELQGYGSIEWINRKNPHSVKLCKMNNGSLAIFAIQIDDHKEAVLWSSDSEHLEIALNVAGFKTSDYFKYKIDDNRLYFTETNEEGPGLFYTDQMIKISQSKYSYNRYFDDLEDRYETSLNKASFEGALTSEDYMDIQFGSKKKGTEENISNNLLQTLKKEREKEENSRKESKFALVKNGSLEEELIQSLKLRMQERAISEESLHKMSDEEIGYFTSVDGVYDPDEDVDTPWHLHED